MNHSEVFQRYEKKYLLTQEQYRLLAPRLEPRLAQDEYGLHTINNIYYDTDTYEMIRRSIDKPVYKEKLRLRSYGNPRQGDLVFAEIKKKFKGIVYKRRVALPFSKAVAFLAGGDVPVEGQVPREIRWMLGFYSPKPKVLLAYDRLALADRQDPGVRVTFDQNIRWRDTHLDLGQGSWGHALLPGDQVLMEVKVEQAIPTWLSGLFCESGIFPLSFSKYGTCYTRYLLPEKKGGLAFAS